MKWRPGILFCAGVLVAAVGLAGCREKAALEPVDLTVCFVSDTRGRLVPCGCFSGQYGGLTRLKTALDETPGANPVRLDVGDAIGGAEDFNVIEYKYMLRAYAAMGFEALNMGEREAELPADQLRRLAKESPVTMISANLLDAATGQPLLQPWKIIERGKLKIALLGVMDSRIAPENLGAGLAVEKIDVTLGKLLPALRSQADVIVLAAFTDEATLGRLAQDYYELNIILGGKVSQPSQKLEKNNRSLVLYTGNEGRALGVLRARISGKEKVAPVDHEIRLLEEAVAEDEGIRTLAAGYRDEIRKTRLAVDDPANLQSNMVPGVKATASYVGTPVCAGCHAGAAKIWQRSRHAEAMEALLDKKADADPNCISCHTVGFGSPSGYRREFAGSKLTDVGCESCHGPGSLHVDQRQNHLPVTFTFRPLGAGDCQKCHFGEFSRPFDFDAFWPHIQHGKEPASAARQRRGMTKDEALMTKN